MSASFSLLGSGGWIPTARRETTCVLLSLPKALFIFDAGTGLSRLLEEKFRRRLEAGREVHLFLSHYHLDHVCGLVYLPGIFKGRTVFLHPPAREITGADPEDALNTLVGKPFNPTALAGMPVDVRMEPLGEGSHIIAGIEVRTRRQIHPDPSAAWRAGDLMAFATDTAADSGTPVFARGARLLVHEAWIHGEEEDDPAKEQVAREAYTGHTSARQAAALAQAAEVKQLVLCHLNPLRSDEYHGRMLQAAQKTFPATRILEDGEVIEL